MELGLGGNGGFSGYRRLSQPSSGRMRGTGMGLPSKTNRVSPPSSSSSASAAAIEHMMDNECAIREQDRFMPIANVIRIMRKILPPHAKISDDAKETIQECVSEFISFITGEANERCQREQRKTITAEDVLWAMSKLGFDEYIEHLTLYLHRYREFEGGERGSLRAGLDHPIGRRANIDHPTAAASLGGGGGGGGFVPYPPPHFYLPHHPPPMAGFFTTAVVPSHMTGFLNDSSSGGGGQASYSQAATMVDNNDDQEQAFGQCKE